MTLKEVKTAIDMLSIYREQYTVQKFDKGEEAERRNRVNKVLNELYDIYDYLNDIKNEREHQIPD